MTASVIDPATFEDEWFGLLSDREMLLWIGVFSSLRDDQGRFVENAALARARLWPYRDVPVADVQAGFDRFVSDGKLHRYEAEDRPLLQIVSWWQHQKMQWARPSAFPPPEGWTDRIRTHQNRSYVDVNWGSPGGFTCAVQVDSPGGQSRWTPEQPDQVDPPAEASSSRARSRTPSRAVEPEPDLLPSTPSTEVGGTDKTADAADHAQSPVETPREGSKEKEKDPTGDTASRPGASPSFANGSHGTAAQKAQRVHKVYRLLVAGKDRESIIAATASWGVSTRTIDAYMAEATERLKRGLEDSSTCDGGEPCPCLKLRGIRPIVARIDPLHSGQIWARSTPIGGAMAKLAAYLCAQAQQILPGLEREQREDACQRMLVTAVERMATAHAKDPIRSLPRYVGALVARPLGDVVGDDLVEELRRQASAGYGKRNGEPTSIGAVISKRKANEGAPAQP